MRKNPREFLLLEFPLVTLIILAGCLLGFIVEVVLLGSGRGLPDFLVSFGVVPLEVVSYFHGVAGTTFLNSVLPFFSSLFLHGGVLHLLTNVLYLWMVGDVLEVWLGRTRFVVLFLFGSAAELIVRIGVSGVPSGLASVGISGAVAALIGGYAVVVGKALRKETGEAGFSGLLRRLPLVLGTAAWFPMQLVNGYMQLGETCQTHDPISWLALLTSFALGMFLVSLSGRRDAPVSAEAPALPTEEDVSFLEA
ncbi:MAG TPA: rhomboid family intramembrane serine protease [Planctomycetota bacterium]|nr:rhomboid family intramembrane serine protease [Planctomycetota bacterium]